MKTSNTIFPQSFRHQIALWSFSKFPQILLVALCNSRAIGEYTSDSDIDLFIIAKSGKLWIVRCITTVISSLLGIRRSNTHELTKWSQEYIKRTRNKFCLSFFITEDELNLASIRIQNDVYLDNWIISLIPLVNKNNTLKRFQEANTLEQSIVIHSPLFIRHSTLETIIQYFWLPKTLWTYEKLWKPWWVVISDTMLKFHDNDQRKIYRDLQN